jgi:hypothetical protein
MRAAQRVVIVIRTITPRDWWVYLGGMLDLGRVRFADKSYLHCSQELAEMNNHDPTVCTTRMIPG